MNLTEYQQSALSTAQYPSRGSNLVYPALGLAGEAGEVVEHVKKAYRKSKSPSCSVEAGGGFSSFMLSPAELALELGDVLWYVAALASEIGYDLSEIARMNLEKLAERKASGTVVSR